MAKSKRLHPGWIIALLTIALISIGTMQYIWLGRLSEGELTRMRSNLHISATRMASDFDSEISRLHEYLFRVDFDQPEQLPNILQSTVNKWQTGAVRQDLIRSVFYGRMSENNTPEVFLLDSAKPELHRVSDTLSNPIVLKLQRMRAMRSAGKEKNNLIIMQGHLLADYPYIIVTVNPMRKMLNLPWEQPAEEIIAVLLDTNAVKSWMDSLAGIHFGTSFENDVDIAVINDDQSEFFYKSNPNLPIAHWSKSDISAEIARIRTQDMFMVRVKGTRDKTTMKTLTVTQSIETSERTSNGAFNPIMDSIVTRLHADIKTSGCTLRVIHREGSLENAVKIVRWRNLFISAGVLLIMAAGLVILLIAQRKERILANQQLEFVAGVSHELKTPLAVIRSAGENLSDAIVTDANDVRRYGELIRGESKRLSDMVDQILDFSGIITDKNSLKMERLDLSIIITKCIASFPNGTPIHFENRQTTHNTIKGNHEALQTIFNNLIANAIKYNRANAPIRITLTDESPYIRTDITDCGIGIDKKDIPHIFEPFFRASGVRDAQIHGNGLGLSIVERYVALHSGTIRVESEPGKGSTFSVFLPEGT